MGNPMFTNALFETSTPVVASLIAFCVRAIEALLIYAASSILFKLLRAYAHNVIGWSTKHPVWSSMLGSLIGLVWPASSNSTPPTVAALPQLGLPFGTVVSFLLSAPVRNPWAAYLLIIMFGWEVVLIYCPAIFVLAVISGSVWEKLGLQRHLRQAQFVDISGEAGGRPESFRVALEQSTKGALEEVRSFLPYALVGAALAVVTWPLIPQDFLTRIAGSNNPLAIPVAAVVGIPLYVRVDMNMLLQGVMPALLEKGMRFDAVVALTISGAGVGPSGLIYLAKTFKPRLLIAWVLTVMAMATLVGLLFAVV